MNIELAIGNKKVYYFCMGKKSDFIAQIPEPPLSKFLFANTRMGWIWLIVRLYIAYEWLMAGWEKVTSP
ncbi:MAG: hypothetical protein ACREGI_00515, partial [Candidatus Levyibacteriota bacterium]